ncbi:MAG: HNH endonuclease, partial [Vicinamibacterales bacterium]
MRDDFSKATIERLAKRAGYLCSNPHCRLPTIGAALSHEGVVNIGLAAHITASAPGGPRYDASLTPEQRRHESNGLWLCQTDGKLVDSDEGHFT